MFLKLVAKPTFIQRPVDMTAEIEKNVTIPCEATGLPKPTILWTRADDQPVSFDGRFRHTPSGSIFIIGMAIKNYFIFKYVISFKGRTENGSQLGWDFL